MEGIELVATFNLKYIHVSSEYFTVSTSRGDESICLFMRVKPEHESYAKQELDKLVASFDTYNQEFKKTLGERRYRVAVMKIGEDSYDIIVSH